MRSPPASGSIGSVVPNRYRAIPIPLLVLIVLLIGAVTAAARIVPQKGIAGARLGMTQTKVLDKLGDPDRTRIRTSPIGNFQFI